MGICAVELRGKRFQKDFCARLFVGFDGVSLESVKLSNLFSADKQNTLKSLDSKDRVLVEPRFGGVLDTTGMIAQNKLKLQPQFSGSGKWLPDGDCIKLGLGKGGELLRGRVAGTITEHKPRFPNVGETNHAERNKF